VALHALQCHCGQIQKNMKPQSSALNELPAIRCEPANLQNTKVASKADEVSENTNPSPVQPVSPKPAISFYEAAYYWMLTRS